MFRSLTPDELWYAFTQQIREDRIDLKLPNLQTLRNVMTPFTTQVGYPLLIVSETDDRKLIIEQVKYAGTKTPSGTIKIFFFRSLRIFLGTVCEYQEEFSKCKARIQTLRWRKPIVDSSHNCDNANES